MVAPNGKVHPAAELFAFMEGDEFQELVDDIREHGLRHPVLLLEDGTLLDGRNRMRACAAAGVTARFTTYDGDDPIGCVVSENVRRRHMTEGQKAFLSLGVEKLYEEEGRVEKSRAAAEAAAKRERDEAGRMTQDEATWPHPGGEPEAQPPAPSAKPTRAPQSRDKAAKKTGTSGRSVARAKRLEAKAADDPVARDLAEKVKTGELALGVADRKLREAEAAAREEARRAEAAAQTELRFDLRGGDFRAVLADLADGSVDLILTDPPYGDDAVALYADLGKFAANKLKPGGSLVAYCGQATLPEVLGAVGTHLRYWWTLALTHSSGPQQLPGKWVMVRWKPLVWFVKDDRGGSRRYVDDVVKGTPPRKDLHEWGQGLEEVEPLINALTDPGQLVVDPFAGSASFGHAANKLGRHFVGSDDRLVHAGGEGND